MTELEFVSPDLARGEKGFRPVWRSPLERALREAGPRLGLSDLSRLGKIEVRGEIDSVDFPSGVEVVRIAPRRALVLCRYEETAQTRAELREQLRSVVDLTGALAGLQVDGAGLMRRLTDLDLDALPATGPVARVPAIVLRDGGSFRIFFPQEYADYLAEVVIDAAEGLLL